MYINFKSKYKKYFWLLIGFLLACIYTTKVKAWTDINQIALPSDVSPLTHNIIVTNGTSPSAARGIRAWIQPKSLNQVFYLVGSGTFPNYSASTGGISVRNSYASSSPLTGQCWYYYENDNLLTTPICGGTTSQVLNRGGSVIWTNAPIYNNSSGGMWFNPYVITFNLNGGTMWSDSLHTIPYTIYDFQNSFENSSSALDFITTHDMTKPDMTFQGWYYDSEFTQPFSTEDTLSHNITLYAKFSNALPDYLIGYRELTLTPNDRYIMLSDISSGNVYIPLRDFQIYGGRLSYYDKDIESQPFTSYIEDYKTTSDNQYAIQSFNLDNYPGADWVMFSKYIYLEGVDDFSYSIWVPDTSYNSLVAITPDDTTGGNYFDFEIKDENGNIQEQQVTSFDFTEQSPLLGNILSHFSNDNYGLSSIVTAPLSLIHSLSTATCSPINLPLDGFTGVDGQVLSLPCMTPIYQNMFGDFFELYQTITTGFIAYWVGIAFFNQIKQLKDPAYDKIEVVRL